MEYILHNHLVVHQYPILPECLRPFYAGSAMLLAIPSCTHKQIFVLTTLVWRARNSLATAKQSCAQVELSLSYRRARRNTQTPAFAHTLTAALTSESTPLQFTPHSPTVSINPMRARFSYKNECQMLPRILEVHILLPPHRIPLPSDYPCPALRNTLLASPLCAILIAAAP